MTDLHALADLLDEEIALYERLAELTEAERSAVFERTGNDLAGIVAGKDAILTRITVAEGRRDRWIADWRLIHGGVTNPVTLGDVIASAKGAIASTLQARRNALLLALEAVANANERNRHLMTSALGIVDRRLDALRRAMSPTYAAGGTPARRASAAVLDMRA